MANKEKYKMANKEAKKAIILEKNKAYEKLYQRLETKDAEKDVLHVHASTRLPLHLCVDRFE